MHVYIKKKRKTYPRDLIFKWKNIVIKNKVAQKSLHKSACSRIRKNVNQQVLGEIFEKFWSIFSWMNSSMCLLFLTHSLPLFYLREEWFQINMSLLVASLDSSQILSSLLYKVHQHKENDTNWYQFHWEINWISSNLIE